MPEKRKKIRSEKLFSRAENNFSEQIKQFTENLYYVSETDAPVLPFFGKKAAAVKKEELLRQIGKSAETPVEEKDFAEFFAYLTEIQDWFDDEERESAKKYDELKNLLEKNLKELKIFKVGEIELDIYVVGLSEDDRLMGIQTKAVET